MNRSNETVISNGLAPGHRQRREDPWPVRRFRLRRGWTLKEAADAAGISASRIRHFEVGMVPPAPDTLTALAAAYHVDEFDLLNAWKGSRARARTQLLARRQDRRRAAG